jgi:uncharacterized repeat protein (TIGR01451 family)
MINLLPTNDLSPFRNDRPVRNDQPRCDALLLGLTFILVATLLLAALPPSAAAHSTAAETLGVHFSYTLADSSPPVTVVQELSAFTRGQSVNLMWGGNDPGGSGIRSYDVRVRDTANGVWTDVVVNTTSTTATFTSTLGHTYCFQVRGVDGAGNVEPWLPGDGDTCTTPCLWTISGTVRDNAGAPVQGAEITTTPDAIGPTMSDADGVYAACVAVDATTYAASAAKAGYGSLPTTIFSKGGDAQADFVLPPADNVVRNWGFESGSLQPDWQTGGLTPAVITTTLAHTGVQAAWLGEPDLGFTTPINVSNTAIDENWLQMAPDSEGGIHMVWQDFQSASATVHYAHCARDGSWIVPPSPISSSGQSWRPQLAVGPDGAVHIVWKEWQDTENKIAYVMRRSDGSWSVPLIISDGLPLEGGDEVPHIAVSASNIVHVVWKHTRRYDPRYQRIYWISRDASGVWSSPRDISNVPREGPQQPRLAVDQTGGVHVVWTDGGNRTLYACRLAEGPWSRPRVIREGYVGDPPELAVDATGKVDVAWYDAVSGSVFYAQGSCQGAWSALETIGVSGYPSLAVDRAGTAHLLTWSSAPPGVAGGQLRYVRRPSGGSWSTPQTLDGVPSYRLEKPSLAVDDSGGAHVVWPGGITGWEPGTIQMYYTHRMGDSAWSPPQNISGAAQWLAREAGHLEVLAVEENGRVHVGWFDGTSSVLDLYYASSALAQQTGDSTLSETITVPPATAHPVLSFVYRLGGVSTNGTSSFGVAVDNGIVTTPLASEYAVTDWAHKWFDLQPWAGQTVTLTFTLHQVAGEQPAWAYLDEVTVGSAHPDVWVSQSGPPAAAPTQKVVYNVAYGNRGGVDAGNGRVTMQLPTGLTFVSADPAPSTVSPNLRWDVGNLAGLGGPYSILVTLQLAASALGGIELTTSAEIASDTQELEQANNSTQISTDIKHWGYLPLASRLYAPPCLVYSDDFSDPSSGWPTSDDGAVSTGYSDGEYRILVRDPVASPVFVWGNWGVSDYSLEVDARAATHPNGAMGLMFALSTSGYYLFEVSDGWFSLVRRDSGLKSWSTLIYWTASPAIRAGLQSNRLRVVRSGSSITLYANGQYIGGTTDGTYGGGGMAVFVDGYSADFDGRFDNFEVYTNTCVTSEASAAGKGIVTRVSSGDASLDWANAPQIGNRPDR